MDNLFKYIYFDTLDYTGSFCTSGYTLPITPFTFVPYFDDGNTDMYSNFNIFWEFGDGTTSNSITAVHSYSIPGWYNVTCYVLGEGGKAYKDKFSQLVLVKDFIPDGLALSGYNTKTQASTKENPFEVFRFNSWQTYDPNNPSDYTINLHVSGNNSPLLNTNTYKTDKWGHLKPTARFETEIFDPYIGKDTLYPVNSLITSNDEIYVRLLNNKIIFCGKNETGSCFAGTSGRKTFYYIDDIPKKVNSITETTVTTIFVNFDTRKFLDGDSFNKNYPKLNYPIINNILDTNSFSVLMQKLNSDHLTITSNGIDSDEYNNPIDTFNIYSEKFTNQKISFVVKIKDNNNFPSKANPVLRMVDTLSIQGGDGVKLSLRDQNNKVIDGVQFYTNFGTLSDQKHGGFFRGYLVSDKELYNVHINAITIPVLNEQFLVDTTYTIINEPQFQKVHDVIFQNTTNSQNSQLVDNIRNVDGLSGIYSSCVITQRNSNGNTDTVIWLVDADRDKLVKYDSNFNVIYNDFILPSNSSPSDICSDSRGNVWVTLYDSVSVVRINNQSNLIDYTIKTNLTNNVINYENTITPACIDTDYLDNVWVSYSNQLSSFIEKYNPIGNFIFRKQLDSNYQITEIVTDLNLNAWAIMKDDFSTNNNLFQKTDKVVKIDQNGNIISYYTINGSLWNITTDCYRNIWLTRNINELVKINTVYDTVSYFTLNTVVNNDAQHYISDLEGITCTTSNTILVIDNTNKSLHYFDSDVERVGFHPKTLKLQSLATPSNRIQDKLNGYGDWNGFKFINKYQHIFDSNYTIQGNSNNFSIFNSASGEYSIRKINENFDAKQQLLAYRFQNYLLDKDIIFNDFFGTILGDINSDLNCLGKVIYEKISNFSDNIANIDTCNIDSLRSMYSMFDEEFYTFSNTNYNFPSEMNRLINLFSINFSKLKGSRNKFDLNFIDKGYNSQSILKNNGEVLYGINKGEELNFLTTVLTAGNYIVAYERFSEIYTKINTDILSASYINFLNPTNKTFLLSTYNNNWGWGLALPDDYVNEKIPIYYKFYNYVEGYPNTQTEGIINWQDKQNTISENLSSIDDWNEIKNKMLTYSLVKGLGIIK